MTSCVRAALHQSRNRSRGVRCHRSPSFLPLPSRDAVKFGVSGIALATPGNGYPAIVYPEASSDFHDLRRRIAVCCPRTL